jgi:hypothetical protein
VAAALLLTFLLAPLTGCQTGKVVKQREYWDRLLRIDFSGLKPAERLESVRVNMAVPRTWEQMPLQKTALYSHQQWRSPSRLTGVGIAHVRLPLPLGQQMVIWLAKQEYTKRAHDGRLIAEWTDDAGRGWFEAENNKYHVRGYVTVEGFNAWFVYFGHKTGTAPDPAEISLAARCVETIVPDSVKLPPPVTATQFAQPPEAPEGDAPPETPPASRTPTASAS